MHRGEELAPVKRAQIVALRAQGLSFTAIGQQLNVKSDTARKVYNKYSESENYTSDPQSNRQTKLNKSDVRHIKRHTCHDRDTRQQPLSEIMNALNLKVSTSTLQRFITEKISFFHRIAYKCPWLSS